MHKFWSGYWLILINVFYPVGLGCDTGGDKADTPAKSGEQDEGGRIASGFIIKPIAFLAACRGCCLN